MPVFSLITGGAEYSNLKYVIREASPATVEGAAAVEEVAINYGTFIMNIVDFVIIALSILVAIRLAMKLKKKVAEEPTPAPATPPEPTKKEVLFTEIRNLSKSRRNKTGLSRSNLKISKGLKICSIF